MVDIIDCSATFLEIYQVTNDLEDILTSQNGFILWYVFQPQLVVELHPPDSGEIVAFWIEK